MTSLGGAVDLFDATGDKARDFGAELDSLSEQTEELGSIVGR